MSDCQKLNGNTPDGEETCGDVKYVKCTGCPSGYTALLSGHSCRTSHCDCVTTPGHVCGKVPSTVSMGNCKDVSKFCTQNGNTTATCLSN